MQSDKDVLRMIATISVSLLTAAPSEEVTALFDKVTKAKSVEVKDDQVVVE